MPATNKMTSLFVKAMGRNQLKTVDGLLVERQLSVDRRAATPNGSIYHFTLLYSSH
ncbi:MAG TPA: hypothetical protein VJ343_00150 [archaeon]|nr:hypothetical protein [archaeon]